MMTTYSNYLIYSILSLFLLLPVISGQAQSQKQDPDEEPKIALRVARISYMEGNVTVLRYTEDDWTDAEINMPLMAGDKVYAGVGARVEIQLDDQTNVRMGRDTSISFPLLDDAVGRLEITKGSVNVHAAEVDYARPPFEISTANLMAVILEHATVRVDVREKGETELSVRRGEINVQQEENEFDKIVRGETLIAANANPKNYKIVKNNQEDTFDQWSDVREAMIAATVSDPYVTPRISGTSDLSRYGDWVEVQEYGKVWRPRTIATDWTPYRDGRWAYREPYGWIWVSYEPWGWAPYHYGRWVFVDDYRWVWVPRETVVVRTYKTYHRPVWYPALVSFTYADHGRHFSLSVSSGYYNRPVVGWFPLGYHDPYHPWYEYHDIYISHRHHHYYPRRSFHVSFGYYPHYRHSHFGHHYDYHHGHHGGITIINNETNIYENSHVRDAVTVVSQDDFVNGNTSRHRRVSIDRNPEPEIQVGSDAVAMVSDRRAIQTRSAFNSSTTNIASSPITGADRGGTSSARTENRRTPETKSERGQTNRTSTTAWQPQEQRQTETKAVRGSGNDSRSDSVQPKASQSRQAVTRDARPTSSGRDSGSVQPQVSQSRQPVTRDGRPVSSDRSSGTVQPQSSQSRQSSVERPRSTSRTSLSQVNYSNTSRQPRGSVSSRDTSATRSSSARPSSGDVNTFSNNASRESSASSVRPRSTNSYIRETYPGRTVSQPRSAAPSYSNQRNTGSDSSRYSSPSRQSSTYRPGSNSRSSVDAGLRNQRPGTVRLSESRRSNSSSPLRVYPPQNRTSANVSRSNAGQSVNPYYSPSRNTQSSGRYDTSSNRSISPSLSVPRGNSNSSIQSSVSRQPSSSVSRSFSSPSSRSSSIQRGFSSSPSRSSGSYSSGRSSQPSRSSSYSSSRSSGSRSSVSRSSAGRSTGYSSSRGSSPSRSSVSSSRSTSSPRSSGSSSASRSSASRSPRR